MLSLLAHGLGDVGVLAALAVGGKWLFLVGLTALLVLRAVVVREDRVAWLLFAAAVGSYTVGSLGYALADAGPDPIVRQWDSALVSPGHEWRPSFLLDVTAHPSRDPPVLEPNQEKHSTWPTHSP